uniref:Monodehydroascorbate reductase n=1 Tax=Tanacetum cinerariifolium TaxID=118510 RepID=A0A6L2NTK6_TANCI|nr:hypothetical protein [Tanacetum cinerariifolium]
MITLSVGHKTTFVIDLLIDFQIKFSLSIKEIVTHWFTLIVLSALRRSDNENMLSLVILILRIMDTTIKKQLAMNEALVPTAQRLKIGKSNFRLLSDIKSKDILHICLRVPGQLFADPPFEEEIFAFIGFLGHSAAIKTLTDVNINKLYQPWRSFAALINKCLTEKSSGYDSLRLSQAQILWGLYHKRNIDYTYLMWEDFVYQVEHKNQKKSNEMNDFMFSTIKLVSRHHNAQQFGAMLPIELTNDEIRNSKAYKEYYAIAIGEAAPKPKASVRRTKSSSDTSITPPTAAASLRPKAFTKGKQTSKASKAKSLSALSEVSMTEAQQLKLVLKRSKQQTNISQPSGSGADEGTGDDNEGKDDDGDEEDEGDDGEEGNGDDDDTDQEVVRDDDKDDDKEGGDDKHESDEETREEESFDPIPQTLEDSEDESDGEEDLGLNIGKEERYDEDEEEDELYRDVNINQGRGLQGTLEVEDTHVTLTPVKHDGQQENSSVSSQFVTSMLNLTLDTNQFAGAVFAIPGIVQHYIDQWMNEAVQAMNEQLEAEVLTRSSHSSRTSYDVAADLFEMELKKILIEKMEGNKEIVTLKRRRDDDVDKDEEPSAGPDRGSKRRREGKELESASTSSETATKSASRSTTGSKSRQSSASESAFAEEPVQTTSQMEEPSHPEFETGADDQSIVQSFQHPEWFSQPQKPPFLDRDWNKTLPAVYESIQPWISELAKQADTRSSFNELMDTPLDFSNFIMNRLRVDTLTPKLLVIPTYDSMKGSCKSLIELEYHLEEVYKATTDQLDWVNPEGQQYPYNLLQPLSLIPDNRGRLVNPFTHFINNDLEYLRGARSILRQLRSQRQQITGISSGLKTWCLGLCGYSNQ